MAREQIILSQQFNIDIGRRRWAYRFTFVWLGIVACLAMSASAQVFGPGPSISGFFDTVIDVPNPMPPPPGILVSGTVGGVMGQTTQVNIAMGGSASNNFTADFGAEVNLSGGTVGDNFVVQNGSTANISGTADVSINFEVGSGGEANVSGGTIGPILRVLDGGTLNVSGTGVVDFTTIRDGGVVHVSGGSVGDGTRVETGAVLNISGGTVGNDVVAFAGSQVNISGGFVFNRFTSFADSVVEISGGNLGQFLDIEGTVNVTGGAVDSAADVESGGVLNVSRGAVGNALEAMDFSSVIVTGGSAGISTTARSFSFFDISGGTIGEGFVGEIASVANISGGSIGDDFESDGVVNITGGEFLGSIEATANAQLSLLGSDFALDAVPVAGLMPGVATTIFQRGGTVLTATLADGSPFEIQLNGLANPGEDYVDIGAQLTVTLVPEPSSALLISLFTSAPLLRRRQRKFQNITGNGN